MLQTGRPSRPSNQHNFERQNRNDNGESIEINPDKVGMVIGRGGSKIRELQDKYSVRINVDRNQNQNGMSSVSLTGDSTKIRDAIREIKELIDDAPARETKESKPEPMEEEAFVTIDWQAAARESVGISEKKKNGIIS